ncbi:hypothetical protein GOP47_0009024 [Adiantum capillus-veneris]|uniref:RING-type E3 ubiquitin transferase n=1 Tax=Adiantum capillus-veneris TaxID=13818 RepID=A0A9D4ZIP8_ADICA|nr:hypothetical protein GOP47_0009024 [Adiantum capillus-veneris]
MVRFSTTLCPSEEPPPAKRLKTNNQQEEKEQEKELQTLPKCRRSTSSSTSTCSTSSRSTLGFDDLHASFDLDILDCNICMEVLSPPIFQCCNGHYTCHDCSRKMDSKCPSCAEPVGKIRNLGLEKILESLRICCKFWSQGCELTLPYRLKKIHERNCRFAPRRCPLPDCNFTGRLNTFVSHFEGCHNVKTLPFLFDTWFTVSLSLADNYLLLQGGSDYYLFHAHEERFGKLLYVSYVHPLDVEDAHTYKMEVKAGKKLLTLASSVQSIQRGKLNLNVMDFLLVPRCFLDNDRFQVEVSIKRSPEAVVEA